MQELPPEGVAVHEPRDPTQQLDVCGLGFLGSDQEEEDLDRLVVDGAEIDRMSANGKCRHGVGHRRGLGVGKSQALADTGGHHFFPIHDRLPDLGQVPDLRLPVEQIDQVVEYFSFRAAWKVNPDQLRRQQSMYLHRERRLHMSENRNLVVYDSACAYTTKSARRRSDRRLAQAVEHVLDVLRHGRLEVYVPPGTWMREAQRAGVKRLSGHFLEDALQERAAGAREIADA